jgi:hypothetical protein
MIAAASSSVSVEAAPDPRRDHKEVRAEAADLRHHLFARAATNRDHCDHRGDADDDAEHGQCTAQLVQAQGVERGRDGITVRHSAAS